MTQLPEDVAAACEHKPARCLSTLSNAAKLQWRALNLAAERAVDDEEDAEDPYADGYALYRARPDLDAHEPLYGKLGADEAPPYLFEDEDEALRAARVVAETHKWDVVVCYEEWDTSSHECLASDTVETVEAA